MEAAFFSGLLPLYPLSLSDGNPAPSLYVNPDQTKIDAEMFARPKRFHVLALALAEWQAAATTAPFSHTSKAREGGTTSLAKILQSSHNDHHSFRILYKLALIWSNCIEPKITGLLTTRQVCSQPGRPAHNQASTSELCQNTDSLTE